MKKSELLKKIKEEYKSGIEFEELDRRNSFTMMFDISDGEFWVNGFTQGSWKEYHSTDIIVVPDSVPYDAFAGFSFNECTQRIFDWCMKQVNDGIIED